VVDGQKPEVDSRDEGKHTGRNDPLFDEAVRVAVGMRLGLSLCVPNNCHCGTLVDAQGLHAMVCKKAPGKIVRQPCSKRHHLASLRCFLDPSCQRALWTRHQMANVQTG